MFTRLNAQFDRWLARQTNAQAIYKSFFAVLLPGIPVIVYTAIAMGYFTSNVANLPAAVIPPTATTHVVVMPPQTVTVVPAPKKGKGVEQAHVTTLPPSVAEAGSIAITTVPQAPAVNESQAPKTTSSSVPSKETTASQSSEVQATNNAPASSSAEPPPSN